MVIFDAINIFSKGINTMATSNTPISPNSDAQLADTTTVILPSGESAVRIEITGGTNVGTSETSNGKEQVPVTEEDTDYPEQTSGYGELHETPEIVEDDSDPMAAALSASQNEENPPISDQELIDASQDAKLSQEEEGQLREYQESQRALLKEQTDKAGNPEGNWTAGSVDKTRTQQTVFVARNSIQKDDWRIRLSLAPSAKYLYKTAKSGDVLHPLAATDGIVFPYTPVIQTAYRANYEQLDLTHSNYKLHFYKNSNVDDIQVTADFTAQDTTEANYLLAVIHFFRSVTKMFYGQDGNNGPKAGTPPPLCYLNGYGQYQFNEHPVLITSFSYILPNDVDYIRAGSPTVQPGTNTNSFESKKTSSFSDLFSLSKLRAQGSRLKTNSISAEPQWTNYSNQNATYVPTKMQIQLSLVPVVTRNDISKNFSLEKYATGELLKGRTRSGGGMW